MLLIQNNLRKWLFSPYTSEVHLCNNKFKKKYKTSDDRNRVRAYLLYSKNQHCELLFLIDRLIVFIYSLVPKIINGGIAGIIGVSCV